MSSPFRTFLSVLLAACGAGAACDGNRAAPPTGDATGGGNAGARAMVCGDCWLDPGETCDDCDTTSGDGCSETCQVEATCDDLRACCFNVICPRVGCNTVPANVCDDGTLYAITMNGDAACASTLARLDAPECRPSTPPAEAGPAPGTGGTGGTGTGSGGAAGGDAGAGGSNASGGVSFAGEGGEAGARSTPCATGTTECGGACVNLRRDSDHCGACGTSCGADQVCEAGECTCGGGALALCNGACLDPLYDERSCSASALDRCGPPCPPEWICDGGVCRCPGSTFPDPEAEPSADAACVRSTTDACPSAYDWDSDTWTVQQCTGEEICAVVQPSSDGLPIGTCTTSCAETLCPNDECVSLVFDDANCGECGRVCSASERCIRGSCEEWGDECDGKIVDLSKDWRNCGECGHECPNPGCLEGVCTCPDLCDSGCTDMQTDRGNCGACGNACREGWVCSAGVCTTRPTPGQQCTVSSAPAPGCTSDPTIYGDYMWWCDPGEVLPSTATCTYITIQSTTSIFCCDRASF